MKLSRKLKTELDQIFEDAQSRDVLITDDEFDIKIFRVWHKAYAELQTLKVILKRLDRISKVRRQRYKLAEKEKSLIVKKAENPMDVYLL